MPELPEVETIVRALKHGGRGGAPIIGKKVSDANLLWDKTLSTPSFEKFEGKISKTTIKDITRRGKFVVIHLDNEFLLIHLRMSGDLRIDPPPVLPPQNHDRLLIYFEDGYRLAFNDTRKFGRAWLVSNPEIVTGNLGPEPFDTTLMASDFYMRLQRKKNQIKSLLLDQSFLAGLGNIYTDESLFRSGIHPMRLSNTLSSKEAERLLKAIRDTLNEAIAHNGASIDWVYRGGEFQNNFRVYQQTGNPCPVCSTPIQRLVVGQRGTHFCPKCQPEGVPE